MSRIAATDSTARLFQTCSAKHKLVIVVSPFGLSLQASLDPAADAAGKDVPPFGL